MRRRHREVIVEISPTRHELAVFEAGRLIGHRAARPPQDGEAGDWAEVVRIVERELAGWVQDLKVEGERATVVYTGPDTAASVYDCPASAGEARAKLAARLAMADTISFPLEQNAHAEHCLCKDRRAVGDQQPKLRTLAIADTEAAVLSLSLSIERAGLKPGRFVPAPGASLAAAVEQLVGLATLDAPQVVLWIGEHSSVMTGGEGEQVAFARLIPVGTETLVESLSRRVSHHGAEPALVLDRFTAREMLFASGVPTIDGWHDATTTLDARAVLPLIQPVLQRLVVELKQSIRFGLEPGARERVVLTVCGPGSHIVGLGASISSGAGICLADRTPDTPSGAGAIQGDIAAVLALGARAPVLLTHAATSTRTLAATRRALVIGAVLGLVAIGVDALQSWDRAREAETTLQALSGVSAEGSTIAVRTLREAVSARMGLARAQTTMREVLGAEVPQGEVLAAIAAATPPGVELAEIVITEDANGSRCGLRGRAFGDATIGDSDRFRAYAAVLAECPLVSGTTLGETRRTSEQGRQTLSFAITLDLVRLPSGALAGASESTEGDGP